MGNIVAETILEWQLVQLQCDHMMRRVQEDGSDPTSMRFYKGVRYAISLKRRVINVSAFTESCGDKQNIFTFLVGGTNPVTWGSTGRKFICTSDGLIPNEELANEAEQRQVWQHEGSWEEVPYAELNE